MITVRNHRQSILCKLGVAALFAFAGTLSASDGPLGVKRTTADIMAQQAVTPPRPVRIMPEREGPDRSSLPQNPAAPATSQIPALDASRRQLSRSIGPLSQTASAINFTGATLTDTGAFPPDTMGTVGPSQFVVFVNGRVRTFDKTTGVADGVINVDSDVFFTSVLTPNTPGGINFTSDPQVRYDRLTGRWILIIIDVPSTSNASIGDRANRVLVAVSDAASAGIISGSTVWTFFFMQQDTVGGTPGSTVASTGEFLDYPSLGVDVNALYIGGNMFGAVSGSFTGCSVYVIRKSSVLGAGPLVATAFPGVVVGGGDGPFAPRGVDNFDPSATEGYFVGVSNAAFSRLNMRRIGTPGGAPTISADIPITVATTGLPITVDHLGDTGGTGGNLDGLDDRLFAAHIRNGRLWTAHNIAVLATGVGATAGGTRRDAARWYELVVPPTTGTPTVNQSGTIFDSAATVAAARQYFIPSVMVSGQGHAAFGASTAGTPNRIDAAWTGRLSTDTLGTQSAAVQYTASSTAYNPPSDPGPTRRWGDYSFTSLDPIDDMTMWTIAEFCSSTNNYGVRVLKVLAPLPATPAGGPLPVLITQPATPYAITGTVIAGSGFYDPGTNLAPPALPFSHITASILNTGTSTPSVNMTATVTYLTPTTITLTITTAGAAVGLHDLRITNPDGQFVTVADYISVPSPVDLTGFSAE
ncbi:MAG: hypothetical protein ABIT01_00550 [Thermoanaerobaculia bacterium]